MIIDDNSIKIIKEFADCHIADIAEEEQADGSSLEWLSIYIWQQSSSCVNNIYNKYASSKFIESFDSLFGKEYGERKLYRGIVIPSLNEKLSINDIKKLVLNGRKYYSFSNNSFIGTNFMKRYSDTSAYRVLVSVIATRYIYADSHRNLNEEEFILDVDDIKNIKIEELYYTKKII